MFGPVPDPVWIFALFWAIGSIHELGHYSAGRWIVGIPATDIHLQSPVFPRYVTLRSAQGNWVAPSAGEAYERAYDRHDPDGVDRERFAAAGEIVQAALVVPIAIALGLWGAAEVATVILSISLLTTFVYVILDASMTAYSGHPWGDYSRLWAVDRKIPPVLLFGFTAVHLGAVNFVV